MKRYTQLETQYSFLSIQNVNQNICWVYVIVDFICMDLIELQGTQSKPNVQNDKSCPQWDSNPLSSAYKANALSITPQQLISTVC